MNTDVRIEAGDKQGIMRLIQYIIRFPFSLERMVRAEFKFTEEVTIDLDFFDMIA